MKFNVSQLTTNLSNRLLFESPGAVATACAGEFYLAKYHICVFCQLGWESVWKGAKVNEAPSLSEKKLRMEWKMGLQTCGTGRESRKRPALVVGWKPYGKCQPI
jgi:hypothetical protein